MDSFGTFVRATQARAIREFSHATQRDIAAAARIISRIRTIPSVAIGGRAFYFAHLPDSVAHDAIINARSKHCESVTASLADSIFQLEKIAYVDPFCALIEYLDAVDWMN